MHESSFAKFEVKSNFCIFFFFILFCFAFLLFLPTSVLPKFRFTSQKKFLRAVFKIPFKILEVVVIYHSLKSTTNIERGGVEWLGAGSFWLELIMGIANNWGVGIFQTNTTTYLKNILPCLVKYSFGQKWANHRIISNAIKICAVVIFDLWTSTKWKTKQTYYIIRCIRETKEISNHVEKL